MLLIIYTDASWHSTVRFTAQMLSERGVAVDILCRNPPPTLAFAADVDFGQKTRLHPIGHGRTGWRDRGTYFIFVIRACLLSIRLRPDCTIGYERLGLVAAFLSTRLPGGGRLLYHNFDLPAAERPSFLSRVLTRLEYTWMRQATAVIASSPGRAARLGVEARLDSVPFVVRNCQRRDSPLRSTGELARCLQQRGLQFERLVVRVGTMGPGHAIEATIRSIPAWDGNWGLVLAGAASEGYLTHLQRLVESLDLQSRVLILPSVPRALWEDCLCSGDLGIALYEPGNINHASMAGAGNKLNFYLKVGIPSIMPNFEDFQDMARRYTIGEIADPSDPASIARAVNSVLLDDDRYAAYSAGAHRSFEGEFNFEVQFAPVLRWVLEGQGAPGKQTRYTGPTEY